MAREEDFDIPTLEDIIFPDNEVDDSLKAKPAKSKNKAASAKIKNKDQLHKMVSKQIHMKMEAIVEKAIFQTLKDSIPIITDDIKEMVISQVEPEIEKIISAAFKQLDLHQD